MHDSDFSSPEFPGERLPPEMYAPRPRLNFTLQKKLQMVEHFKRGKHPLRDFAQIILKKKTLTLVWLLLLNLKSQEKKKKENLLDALSQNLLLISMYGYQQHATQLKLFELPMNKQIIVF